jgi:hypothetical protein
MAGVVSTVLQGFSSARWLVFGFKGGGTALERLHWGRYLSGSFQVRFFCTLVFSITSLGSFFGSFFQPSNVFNNFSASFFGPFLASCVCVSFVFSNFSGSFF